MSLPKSYTLCDGIYLSESAASKLTDESLKWEERKPVGIRFNPSDQALARIFIDKLFSRPGNIVLSFFRDINVYDYEPWNLSSYAHEFGEGKMYFFTTIQKNYTHTKGTTMARVVPGGYWKKTGSISSIVVKDNDEELSVGKTSFAFYKKDEKTGEQEKTRWIIKEYMLEMQSYEKLRMSDDLDPLALCVVYLNDPRKQNHSSESGTRS